MSDDTSFRPGSEFAAWMNACVDRRKQHGLESQWYVYVTYRTEDGQEHIASPCWIDVTRPDPTRTIEKGVWRPATYAETVWGFQKTVGSYRDSEIEQLVAPRSVPQAIDAIARAQLKIAGIELTRTEKRTEGTARERLYSRGWISQETFHDVIIAAGSSPEAPDHEELCKAVAGLLGERKAAGRQADPYLMGAVNGTAAFYDHLIEDCAGSIFQAAEAGSTEQPSEALLDRITQVEFHSPPHGVSDETYSAAAAGWNRVMLDGARLHWNEWYAMKMAACDPGYAG